jgi:hypothetical protein
VTFALSNTTLGRNYRLYKGTDAVMNVLPGTGGAATFTGTFAGAGTYTAQVIAESGNCAAVMNGTHDVSENLLPDTPNLAVSAATVCQNTNVVFRASGTAGSTLKFFGPAGTASGTDSGTLTISGSVVGTKSVSAYALLASGGTTCQSANATTVTAVVATMPAAATVTRVSAATVCQNTNVVFRASGTAGSTYTWLGTTGTPSGTGSGTLTVSGATTGTKSVSAYARLASSGTTCQSGNAATVTAVVNPQPSITRRSGNASQTVNAGSTITPIVYTANNSATISRSGSTFPNNLTGAANGSSYTISGTPSATGTFGYSLTASNGCTSAAASGTITVVGTPPNAASTRTWTFGSLTWSDNIHVPACTATAFYRSNTSPVCVKYTSGTNTWYYYNWPYVNQNGSTMCPAPWRIPTESDRSNLAANTTGSALVAAWGTGGYYENTNNIQSFGATYILWTSTQCGNPRHGRLSATTSTVGYYCSEDYAGNQVRCVK